MIAWFVANREWEEPRAESRSRVSTLAAIETFGVDCESFDAASNVVGAAGEASGATGSPAEGTGAVSVAAVKVCSDTEAPSSRLG